MNFLLLSAGKATRLGGACKALNEVAGKPMIEHLAGVVGEKPVVACRPEDALSLMDSGWAKTSIPVREPRGPGQAVDKAGVFLDPDQPTVVAFADTFFTQLPAGGEWCAVGARPGGRAWDVAFEDGSVRYMHIPESMEVSACAGLYRFSDTRRLRRAAHRATVSVCWREVGMGDVLREYGGLPFVDLPSWQDVGDFAALAAFKAPEAV